MHVNYKCDECDEIIEVSFSIVEGPPAEVLCPKCNKRMHRIWKAAIHIPEDFGDDLTTTIAHRMSHGARPSGKGKINY